MALKKKIYAVYKKDELLFMGYVDEVAKFFNVKEDTVKFWASPANKRRCLNHREFGGRKIAESFYEY